MKHKNIELLAKTRELKEENRVMT